jgi:hypothetical protein
MLWLILSKVHGWPTRSFFLQGYAYAARKAETMYSYDVLRDSNLEVHFMIIYISKLKCTTVVWVLVSTERVTQGILFDIPNQRKIDNNTKWSDACALSTFNCSKMSKSYTGAKFVIGLLEHGRWNICDLSGRLYFFNGNQDSPESTLALSVARNFLVLINVEHSPLLFCKNAWSRLSIVPAS